MSTCLYPPSFGAILHTMEPSSPQTTPSKAPEPQKQTLRHSIFEFVKFVIIAVIIVVPVRMYIAQPFIVNGESMDPTFATGQYLIIDEISYRFSPPERGDIVVLHDPRGNSKKYLIKRVVGLPGETLEIADGTICISTGEAPCTTLEEPYVLYPKTDEVLRVTLGQEEFFMMGDNRAASLDSRFFGPVKRDLIVGRAFVRLLPPTTASFFPGKE